MGMSIPYAATGRVQQKNRTRAAMVAAARELLAEGAALTVEQAADRAGVSRTTAYRYFVNQRDLVVAICPELDVPTLLGPDAPSDPIARLDRVTEKIGEFLLANEPALRAMLRLSLGPTAPDRDALVFRQGRAIGWLEDALSPLRKRLGKPAVKRLVLAIRATCGIEPFVWLIDIGGLSRSAAIELMRSSARTLLRAAL